MFSVQALAAHYGASQVLHGVDLACAAGEIVCLLGRNGAGKSTTLKTVMGLVRATGGAVSFDGRAITGLPPYAVARLGIGYVPEERLIFPDLTVMENLSMGVWRSLRRPPASAFERVLAIFPRLAETSRQQGRTLSGGEQQMLAIGRALMAEPRLLLVDEPTEGLAPVIVRDLERALQALSGAGFAVLVVESKLAVARRIADRIVVMTKGATVFDGTPAALEADAALRRQHLEV